MSSTTTAAAERKPGPGPEAGAVTDSAPAPSPAHPALITDRTKLPLYPATYFEQKQLVASVPNPVFLFNVQGYRSTGSSRAFVRMPYNQLGNACSRDDLTAATESRSLGLGSSGPMWNSVQTELTKIQERLDTITSTSFVDPPPPGELEPIIAAIQAYNPAGCKGENFRLLRCFFEGGTVEAYQNNLKSMVHVVEQALELPKIMPHPIPLLQCTENKTLVMTQQQVFSLLANAFLCTFGRQPSNYADINFFELFSSGPPRAPGRLDRFTEGDYTKLEKLQCIFNYFYTMYLRNKFELWSHGRVVTFERRYLTDPEIPNWAHARCDKLLSDVEININGKIEDCGKEMLQVDFANPTVGGNVFGEHASMEEIRFSICPELIVARLFTEQLGEDEVLLVTGCEQFSIYEGSGTRFRCTGLYQDPAVVDSMGRVGTELVAMDPLRFHPHRKWEQFSANNIHRELNKCYTAFMLRKPTAPRTPIATGNWGCGGGGNGDPELKFLVQLLAASAVERKLVMFVFTQEEQAAAIEDMVIFLKRNRVTVQTLYRLIRICADELVRLPNRGPRLFKMIQSDVRCLNLIRGLPEEHGMAAEYGKGRRAMMKPGTGRPRRRKKQFEDLCAQT